MHVLMTGTHQGPFMGIAQTGKSFSVDQMRIVRIREGQMTDSWAVIDWLGWRQQLGALPPTPAPRQPVTATV
jgi:predicted ester cyclase